MDEMMRFDAFVREQYEKVVAASQDGDASPLATPELVGSLCALGRMKTAETLFEQTVDQLSSDDIALSFFLFSQSSLRVRDFESARAYLERFVELAKKNKSNTSLLFLRLGFAQFNFYRGYLGRALDYGNQALELVLQSDHPVGRVNIHETLALVQSYRGAAQAAEKHFALAKQWAESWERPKQLKQIELASVLHSVRSQPGRDHSALLATALGATDQKFHKLSLLLEMARQEVFRDELDRAEDRLEEAYELLDGGNDSRFFSVYGLRQAEISLKRNRLRRALHHLDYTQLLLDGRFDSLLLLETSALRARIYESLSQREQWEFWEEKAHALQKRTEASWPHLPDLAEVVRIEDENPWNPRQRNIIVFLQHNDFVNVSECREMFEVSDITACRDLAALTKAGVLERQGKARATRYRLAGRNCGTH